MATINLRGDLATGTTLTFAQVDGNFTNINNELIDVNWNNSTGVVTFTPVGSATDSVTYPVVTIDLDAKYTKRASDSDLSQMNIIKDYTNGISSDSMITTSDGWVSPLEKLHIDHPKSFLINSPAFNTDNDRIGNPNYLDGDDYTVSFYKRGAIDQGDHLSHWRNANEVIHNTSTSVKIDVGDLRTQINGTRAGKDLIHSSMHEFMSAMASLDSNIHGAEIVLYKQTQAEDTDSTDYRVRGTITGVTFEDYGTGIHTDMPEYVTITFTVIDRGVHMNASSTTYCDRIDFKFKPSAITGELSPSMGIYAPRAPLVPPLTGSHGAIEDKVARVLAVNRHSDLMDKSDISLRYADYDDLLVGGVRTPKDFTLTPFFAGEVSDAVGGLSNGGEYELFRKIIDADGITEDTDGGNVTVHGGNVVVDTSFGGSKPDAGDLILSGGYLLDSDPLNLLSGTYADIDDLHSQEFLKVGAPSIELKGQKGTTARSRMVLNAGINYIKTKNDRDGNDIEINLGTPTGTGEPGGLMMKVLGPPTSSTTSSDQPIIGTTDTPWNLVWNNLCHKYRIETGRTSYLLGYENEVNDNGSKGTDIAIRPVVSNTASGSLGSEEGQYHRQNMYFAPSNGGILREPAVLSGKANANDNPFYCTDDLNQDSITTTMKDEWQDSVFKGTTTIHSTHFIRSCIASAKYRDFTSDNMDDAAYSNGYAGVYERIAPSLNVFAGSTEDYDHVLTRNDGTATALERTGGDTISLGQYGIEYNRATFLAGFVVDGRTARIKGQTVEIDGGTNVVGDITATGDVTAFSDESIKENVEVIEDAVDKVQQLNGYTFDRTDVETSRQTGVIAQEVLKVLPEAVGEKDGIHTVAYGNMVGLLIEAIKEQQGQIDSLKEELQSIKSINK